MRKCSINGCDNGVFTTDKTNGKGYCIQHKGYAYKNRDWATKANKSLPKPRIPIKRYNPIKKLNEALNDPYAIKLGITSELGLFNLIWEEREHICFVSDRSLEGFVNTNLYVNMFSHSLSKAKNKYYKFKYYKNNVVLLHPDCHYLLDFGSEGQRDASGYNWQKLYDLKEELLKEYNELF